MNVTNSLWLSRNATERKIMAEPASAGVGIFSIVALSGLAIQVFGVPPSALVGAALGASVALYISPVEAPTRKLVWFGMLANFVVGIYGGQILKEFFFPSIAISAACASLAALGIFLVPVLKKLVLSWASSKVKGGEA
jgi:hypothetical protein